MNKTRNYCLAFIIASFVFNQVMGWTSLDIAIFFTSMFLVSTVVVFAIYDKIISPKLSSTKNIYHKKSATKELLSLKSLLDQKIITQEEYDLKASELKKKIL